MNTGLAIIIATACICWTVTEASIFKELQAWLKSVRDNEDHSKFVRKAAEMPMCPYCLSHYIIAAAILIMQYPIVVNDWRGYILSEFFLVFLTSIVVTLYHLLRVALRWSKCNADLAHHRCKVTGNALAAIAKQERKVTKTGVPTGVGAYSDY